MSSHQLSDRVSITFLGGANGIGASCAIVDMDHTRILIDCGQRMGAPTGQALPDFSPLQDGPPISAVLITHAHTDHIGALPALTPFLPDDCPIYATAPTIALIKVMLDDSVNIMFRHRSVDGTLGMFPPTAVPKVLQRLEEVAWHQRIKVDRLTCIWHPSGHILGAGMIAVKGVSQTILFTGDLSIGDQRSVAGATLPAIRPDVLVMESTYGGRMHTHRPDQERLIVERVRDTIKAGGHVLFPTFALGRAQEVLMLLANAMRAGDLPHCPIYADGMIRKISRIYSRFPDFLTAECRYLVENGLHPIFQDDLPIYPVRDDKQRETIATGRPCVVVASSGMLQGGASQFYAQHWLTKPESLVLITGYQDEESPGQALLTLATLPDEGNRFFMLGGVRTTVRCRVESYQLSAHADHGELLTFACRSGADEIILVHGDETARSELARGILSASRARVHVPENGSRIDFYAGDSPRDGKAREKRSDLLSFWPPWDPEQPRPLNLAQIHEWMSALDPPVPFVTLEELAELWKAPEAVSKQDRAVVRRAIYHDDQPYFIPDARRPYRLKLTPAANLAQTKAQARLPMDSVQQQVRQVFPKTSGLKSFALLPEIDQLMLLFEYPEAIMREHAHRVRELEQQTGWNVTIVGESSADDLKRLADRLISNAERDRDHDVSADLLSQSGIRTIEVAPERVVVELVGSLDDDDLQAIVDQYQTRTGRTLEVKQVAE